VTVALPRVDILGVRVSAIRMSDALDTIDGWITRGERQYVCVTGVHGVMESGRDDSLRRIHNAAGLVTPDGMPLVWLCRWRGFLHVERVYGPDLMLACCERSVSRGYRHFLYGGAPDVPETLAERLRSRFPGLEIVGTYSPPFRPPTADEQRAVVQRINEARPHIVWVGLSTPKQERWMADHVGQLSAAALIGVGAAFDFHAGRKRQAPLWMQRSGLEWAFRMVSEPRRLGPRYLVNNPSFMWQLVAERLRAVPRRTARERGRA
jgi:N-acetylglucosaminyldiphosphoundecaprenol N-acetyl-beta-D-mannosaminyltransferase